MNQNAILYFCTFLAVGALILVFIIEFILKKWKCIEQKCIQVLGGDYDTEGQCKDVCKKSSEVSRKTYDCVNDTCDESDGDGIYNTKLECQNECGNNTKVIVEKPYGYPYYGYSYNRYPYYWWPRRRRSRGPRRRRRGSPRFRATGRRR